MGAIKTAVDLFQGETQNILLSETKKMAMLSFDVLRLHPIYGIVFNVLSLGLNLGSAINPGAIQLNN